MEGVWTLPPIQNLLESLLLGLELGFEMMQRFLTGACFVRSSHLSAQSSVHCRQLRTFTDGRSWLIQSVTTGIALSRLVFLNVFNELLIINRIISSHEMWTKWWIEFQNWFLCYHHWTISKSFIVPVHKGSSEDTRAFHPTMTSGAYLLQVRQWVRRECRELKETHVWTLLEASGLAESNLETVML